MNPLRQETIAPTTHLSAHFRNHLLPMLKVDALLRSLGAALERR